VIPRSARVNLLSAIYVDKQRTTFDTTTSSLVSKVREVGPLLLPAVHRTRQRRALAAVFIDGDAVRRM